MSDITEAFRQELMTRIADILPDDMLNEVMTEFDVAISQYDVSKKEVSLAVVGDIPEVVKYYIASKAVANCSKQTLNQYKYKLQSFFKAVPKPYTNITTNDIRVYLYKYKQENKVNDHTVENTRRILNAFFTWMVDNEYLPKNPVSRIETIHYQEHEREPLTPYELELMRWNCKNIREKALVDFLFATGCRVSECAQVNISDVDWVTRSVIIRHGKGDKRRTVFFNAECELTLRKYLESRKDTNEALFVSSSCPKKRISVRAIQIAIKEIGERSNIKAFPHKLRHTFATAGIKGGMPLERLQALMGHANPHTTLIYAKLDSTDLQREHQRVFS